jgi:hypothetical protein
MADEPISALTLFTSYSTADEVEILDVSDTTFASTGTNKRIQFSTLLQMAGVGSGAGGGSGTVTSVGLSLPPFITVTGSPVSTSGTLTGTLATQTANTVFAGPTSGSAAAPTFRPLVAADLPVFVASGSGHAAGAVPDPGSTPGSPLRFLREDATWDAVPTASYSNAVLSAGYVVTSSMANIGLSVSLPVAGTYMIAGNVRARFMLNGSVGQSSYISTHLYDSTKSVVLNNSSSLICYGMLQVASQSIYFIGLGPVGPTFYTVTGPTTIQLQAAYTNTSGTISNTYIDSDTNGYTSISAVRIY